jgi:hypothetical protein
VNDCQYGYITKLKKKTLLYPLFCGICNLIGIKKMQQQGEKKGWT